MPKKQVVSLLCHVAAASAIGLLCASRIKPPPLPLQGWGLGWMMSSSPAEFPGFAWVLYAFLVVANFRREETKQYLVLAFGAGSTFVFKTRGLQFTAALQHL